MTLPKTDPSETIAEWCKVEKMSKATFYGLRQRNPELAPQTIEIPKTRIVRVVESHEAWRARITKAMKVKAARLEVARRREIAAIAGRIAAQSPHHVSRRPPAPRRSARRRER